MSHRLGLVELDLTSTAEPHQPPQGTVRLAVVDALGVPRLERQLRVEALRPR